VGIWVAAAALTVNAGHLFARRFVSPLFANHQPTIVPSTVILRTVLTAPPKPPSEKMRELRAVRSDGAIVRRAEGVTASGAYITRDLYFPDGVHVATDDVAETKNTGRMPDKLRPWRDPASDCLNTPAGSPPIPGQEVVGRTKVWEFSVVEILARNAIQSYAPSLGCQVIFGRTVTSVSGWSMVKEPVSILVGEPDPSLFLIPEGFREVSSTELSKRK